jgi:hypothetical protein
MEQRHKGVIIMADDPFPPGFEAARPTTIGNRSWAFRFPATGEPHAEYSIEILDQRNNVFETKTGSLFPAPDHLTNAEKAAIAAMDTRLKAKAEAAWIK